jgi:protein TonB
MEGSLLRKVQPIYPPLAKSARIQGPVVLFAVISRSGTIDNLQVLSGHPMLVQAAIDAVQQWRYRPYILNQEPIEVETQITINFVLGN